MADESDVLKGLEGFRTIGVKRIVFAMNVHGEPRGVQEVEFFPLSVFDHAGALLSGEVDDEPEDRRERDTEAPPAVKVPPAMARVLQKGSVS